MSAMASYVNMPQVDHSSYYENVLMSSYGNEQFSGSQVVNSPSTEPCYVQHSIPVPVTVRVSILNLQFMKLLNCKVKQQVLELQKYYYLSSSEIETGRFTSLSSANNNPLMQCSINTYFDQQHTDLIVRIEHSLNLIEQRIAQPKPQKRPDVTTALSDEPSSSPDIKTSPKSADTNNIALRIMNNWYERNSEHPYPSYDTAEVMAKAGGITVEQVKKWFANKRLRLGNTKHITQIAKRRKRARTVSKDDILLTGASLSD